MGALFFSETPDHVVFQSAKYKVDERVKVTQVKTSDPSNYDEDTLYIFESCVGKEFTINDVVAFEMEEDDKYLITYEIEVSDTDSVYLDEDEIELIT